MKCRECVYMHKFANGLYGCMNHSSENYLMLTGVCSEDECDDGEYLVEPEGQDDNTGSNETA